MFITPEPNDESARHGFYVRGRPNLASASRGHPRAEAQVYSEAVVVIRPAAFVVMLSLSMAAAAPLLCEMSCLAPEHAVQSCHEEESGTRLSMPDQACDHTPDAASLVAAAPKITSLLFSVQVLAPGYFGSRSADLPIARGAHGPPGALPSADSLVRTILRI